eukprot:gene98-118_t
MAAARRSSGSGTRDLLYHVDWERTPTTATPALLKPLPLEQLRKSAQIALEDIIASRGRAELEATMASEDELAAAQIARGLRQMSGGNVTKPWTVETLKIAEPMRRVYQHLVSDLAKRGLLEAKGDGYLPTSKFDVAADSATDELRSFISKHPGHLPEGLLCSITC